MLKKFSVEIFLAIAISVRYVRWWWKEWEAWSVLRWLCHFMYRFSFSQMVIHVSEFIFSVNFSIGLFFSVCFPSWSFVHYFYLLPGLFTCDQMEKCFAISTFRIFLCFCIFSWCLFSSLSFVFCLFLTTGTSFVRSFVRSHGLRFPVSISFCHQRIKAHGKMSNFTLALLFTLFPISLLSLSPCFSFIPHYIFFVCSFVRSDWLNDRTKVIPNANIKKLFRSFQWICEFSVLFVFEFQFRLKYKWTQLPVENLISLAMFAIAARYCIANKKNIKWKLHSIFSFFSGFNFSLFLLLFLFFFLHFVRIQR